MKLTEALERVLRVFLEDPTSPRYGYDLMKAARLPSGTLYPMLARLTDQGLVESHWEKQGEESAGRPPRKYYKLTIEGLREARCALAEAHAKQESSGLHGLGRPLPDGALW
ncbi:PadR family transcriptional regulator [Actinomadura nitritigenes]|uniref:PadR family transcriptional regulator n=1 Tax=Actinomadura nitritigenes TaxID=134602 RepID=UPI0036CAD0E6